MKRWLAVLLIACSPVAAWHRPEPTFEDGLRASTVVVVGRIVRGNGVTARSVGADATARQEVASYSVAVEEVFDGETVAGEIKVNVLRTHLDGSPGPALKLPPMGTRLILPLHHDAEGQAGEYQLAFDQFMSVATDAQLETMRSHIHDTLMSSYRTDDATGHYLDDATL